MSEIVWHPFYAEKTNRKRVLEPQISFSISGGRIFINEAACKLIDDFYSYRYAEIYMGSVDGEFKKVAVTPTNNSIVNQAKLHRRKYKKMLTEGVTLYSKSIVKQIFEELNVSSGILHYRVERTVINKNASLILDLYKSRAD